MGLNDTQRRALHQAWTLTDIQRLQDLRLAQREPGKVFLKGQPGEHTIEQAIERSVERMAALKEGLETMEEVDL